MVHNIDFNIATNAEDLLLVAFFHASVQINVLESTNVQIAVGCASGDVLHLRAAFVLDGTTLVACKDTSE